MNPTSPANHAALIAAACRAIEQAEREPSLAELAAKAGFSTFHFQRLFKQHTGVTPKAYATAQRAERARHALAAGKAVTTAIYDAGFQSSGRFYEKSTALLGMKPQAYRKHGKGETIRFAIGQCSLGGILVAASQKGVCAVLLGNDPQALVEDLQRRFAKAELVGGDADFEKLVATVVGLVETPGSHADLPLDIRGTAFQQRVWQALRKIPSGKTASYAEIAERIGSPKAVRAVGTACGANPVAILIPCHRVVKTDGALSGYHWGVAIKKELLAREARTQQPEAK